MAKVSPVVATPVPRSPRDPAPLDAQARRRRVFAWGLALVALAFVAYAVPLRDRCEDPAAPAATAGTKAARVPLSRHRDGCVLHRPEGDRSLKASECAALTCEPGLVSTLADARLGLVAALLAMYLLGTLVWAARWRALLALAKVPLGLLETWRITLEAQAGGIVLPGGIGGDALRVGFVAQRGASLPVVIAAVLLDRAIGLVTLAGLAAAFAATTVTGGDVPALLLVVLAAIPVAFVAGLSLLRWRPVARAPFFAAGPLARVARPVLEYLGEPGAPRAILTGLGLSLVVSATQFAALRGLVAALGGTPTSELWIYVGTTMAFIVAAIPALPGGWGTSDLAYVTLFAKAGLAPSLALGVSLLYRLFWYASGGVGAVLYLLRQHAGRAVK
jgi:glycosyltransferase 2 family protein